MEAQIQKWGNSLGIRLPMSLLKELDIKVTDTIKIEKQDDKIILTKSNKKKISLKELFKNYQGEYENTFEWDDPQGGEIW